MREHSRDRGRLEDILKYAQNVEQIVSGITYEQFVADIRIYYSVMKNVEVIGEAANIYMCARSMGSEPDGMTDAQMKEVQDAFNLPKKRPC